MICLVAGFRVIALGVQVITLSWEHSVQKTRWQETWVLDQEVFVLTRAAVEGSGAGMDPPSEATFVDGKWVWSGMRVPQLVLRRSQVLPDYALCAGGFCRSMEAWGAEQADPVVLRACGEPTKEPVQGGENRPR